MRIDGKAQQARKHIVNADEMVLEQMQQYEIPLSNTCCGACGCEPAWLWPNGDCLCAQCFHEGEKPNEVKRAKRSNKYHAVRTNGFASAKEERRYRELLMMQQGGAISDLECQVVYVLCEKPSVKVVVDFRYQRVMGHPFEKYTETILEDVKGIDKRTGKPVTLTAAARVKYAWLKEKYGLTVKIV